MYVAMGMNTVSEQDLTFAKQIGVTHLITRPEYRLEDGCYSFERLVQLRTRVEAAGLRVAALHDVPPEWNEKIRRGEPGRDEQIAKYAQTLTNMGAAGIPVLGYSFHAVKVWRTSRDAPGRGGAAFTAYDHALMAKAPRVGPTGMDDAQRWESYTYFVEAVIPAAEAAGVKMALHPDDPPISPIAGGAYIFRDVAAFDRALDIVDSPSHGLLFCQGCFSEMVGAGVLDAIRHLGRTGKVHYVHFRNVVGQLPAFREAFIDNGDIHMLEAMQAWKDVGYDGPMMPDHHPRIIGDTPYGHRARAHAIGYMKALMTAVGGL